MENSRRSIIASDTLLAEEIVARPELAPSGVTAKRQVAVTCGGAFEFHVGGSVSWIDPSRMLFAEAGQEFRDRHVVPGVGHHTVILTPADGVLEELSPVSREAFADRVRGCPVKVQMFAQLLRRTADNVAAEELGLGILVESVGDIRRVSVHDPHCVKRAKALLHDSEDGRLTLSDIAGQVGVTPIHLTQAFKRSEGVPLYRYQTELRLRRALAELPGREDITDLALELGFSSHSHFTAVFRSNLGVTPSAYRSSAGSGREACPNR